MKELKTFNLNYHFFINKCALFKQTLSLEIHNIKAHVFWLQYWGNEIHQL